MDYSYRITKYRYLTFGGTLRSPATEWTSFSEIDQEDEDRTREYLATEGEYISLAIYLCNSFGASSLKVQGLENSKPIENDICEGQSFTIAQVPKLIASILREEFWCRLIGDGIEFHFGYDYYMYFVSDRDASEFILNSKTKLFTQEFLSPYMID